MRCVGVGTVAGAVAAFVLCVALQARAEEEAQGEGQAVEVAVAAVDASPIGALRTVLASNIECAPFCVAKRVVQRPMPAALGAVAKGGRVEVWSAGGDERGGSLRLFVLLRDGRGEVAAARTPILTPRDDCGMGKCWDATVAEIDVAPLTLDGANRPLVKVTLRARVVERAVLALKQLRGARREAVVVCAVDPPVTCSAPSPEDAFLSADGDRRVTVERSGDIVETGKSRRIVGRIEGHVLAAPPASVND